MCYITDVGLDQATSKTRCKVRAKIITSKVDGASPAAKRITQGKVTFDDMSQLVQESAPYNCPIQAPFDPCMAPFTIQPHVAPFKPCTAPFKWQPVVIDRPAMHQNDQKMSLVIWDQDQPHTTAPFDPHSALFTIQPRAAWFKPRVAPFKQQPVVREKQGRYQNDQHDELSYMGPRSALYDCPIWAPFGPIHCSALCGPVQAPYDPIHHSAPCRSPIQRR